MKAFLFPGQGSQRKGMGAGVFELFPQYVEIANSILGYDIVDLCLNDPDRKLNETEFTQPAVFTVSALSYLAHIQNGQGRPDFVAGHSVGEYAALVAAGSLRFESALALVNERAVTMARLGQGGLAAVLGHDEDSTQRLIATFADGDIEIANLNTPDQTVVGGTKPALAAFVEACGDNGVKAIPLRVSGAFHTSLMAD
ncbi:MAG: ACP S-malonyltransferase, partial [Pseudomonadota bacterium]